MDRFIVEDEKQLSPVVVVTTVVLMLAFVLGFAVTAVGTFL